MVDVSCLNVHTLQFFHLMARGFLVFCFNGSRLLGVWAWSIHIQGHTPFPFSRGFVYQGRLSF